MTLNPARTIEQARKEAKKSFRETCGPEIQKICDIFSHETGLAIIDVNFSFSDVTSMGEEFPTTILAQVDISHNNL